MGDGTDSSGESIQRVIKFSIYNSGVAIKKYICDLCKRECETERPDEETMAEAQAIFGASLGADPAEVCDDCWEMMKCEDPWLREQSNKFKVTN
jgi:hypothetical protein